MTQNFMPDLQQQLMDFRKHLETFYEYLHLAPPYHSIEKALSVFSSEFQAKSLEVQKEVHLNRSMKFDMYNHAFIASGLYKKHRGIIVGLLKSETPPTIPEEYQYLTLPYLK